MKNADWIAANPKKESLRVLFRNIFRVTLSEQDSYCSERCFVDLSLSKCILINLSTY